MSVRDRSRALAMVLAGLALVIGPFVLPEASAQQEELIGYLGVADSDAIAQTGGDPSNQGYPQVQSKTAHTFSSLDTGENGLALASSQWPGEFAGNAGSLFQVFGAPEEAGALNYPVRAEASTAGESESAMAGMSARVEGPLAEAIAEAGDFDGAGSEFLSYGDARSVSRSEIVGETVTVTATATVTDIDIGGIITIDSVQTTAIARTDGITGSNEGSTVVNGLEIAGQPARVDENGVRAGDGSSENPADAVTQTLMDDVLSSFADAFVVEMYVARPRATDAGTTQEYRSGALVIDITLGDPEAGQGGDGALAFGGSNAFVQATALAPFAPPTTTSFAPTTGVVSQPGPATPTPSASGAGVPEPIGTTAPTTSAPTQEVAAPPALDSTPIVDRFSGLGFVMPFIVLLGGLVAGRGLHRFHQAVTASTSSATCLIDGDQP